MNLNNKTNSQDLTWPTLPDTAHAALPFPGFFTASALHSPGFGPAELERPTQLKRVPQPEKTKMREGQLWGLVHNGSSASCPRNTVSVTVITITVAHTPYSQAYLFTQEAISSIIQGSAHLISLFPRCCALPGREIGENRDLVKGDGQLYLIPRYEVNQGLWGPSIFLSLPSPI